MYQKIVSMVVVNQGHKEFPKYRDYVQFEMNNRCLQTLSIEMPSIKTVEWTYFLIKVLTLNKHFGLIWPHFTADLI